MCRALVSDPNTEKGREGEDREMESGVERGREMKDPRSPQLDTR